MLQRSPFVQAAVNKPWYTYLLTLLQVSPVHVLGLVGAVLLAAVLLPRPACDTMKAAVCLVDGFNAADTNDSLDGSTAVQLPAVESMVSVGKPGTTTRVTGGVVRRQNSAVPHRVDLPMPPAMTSSLPMESPQPDGDGVDRSSTSAVPVAMLQVLVLSLWPLGFLAGLTLLGSLGSGFQSRFLLPMLPGTCILAAVFVQWAQQCAAQQSAKDNMSCVSSALAVVMLLFVIHSTVHVVYYGVMYAPLYADLDVSIVDVICAVLTHAYSAPESREGFQATLKFMSHFGLVK